MHGHLTGRFAMANADMPSRIDEQQLFRLQQALVTPGGRNPDPIGCNPHADIALCANDKATLVETLTDRNNVLTNKIRMR
jgi:hypothetical protein